jgi:spore maturation protein CgeB
MRFVLFYQSLVSDWNHPTAHMLRGIATELVALGHSVQIFEPDDGWSLHNLREQAGEGVIKAFHATYPQLRSHFYDLATLDLDAVLADADVVIAHEWNDPVLLRRLGEHRARASTYKLLFHDAPHRSLQGAPAPLLMRARVLTHYDGVLAASDALRRLYETHAWAMNVWTWREAVDARVFRPWPCDPIPSLEVIWIGAWGSPERASELDEFLIEPIRALGLRARFYGARYPKEALSTLRATGIDYGGWIADFSIPAALAAGRFSINVPRRMQPYGLPHTPAIRVLQALACAIPVVSAPWDECDRMLSPGTDLLMAHDGTEVKHRLMTLHRDPELARSMGYNGHRAVMNRHTCAHRAQELLQICQELQVRQRPPDELEIVGPNLPPVHQAVPTDLSHVPAAWS